MNGQPSHAVVVTELRHRLAAVMALVRHGETVDVTEHGTVIACTPATAPISSAMR